MIILLITLLLTNFFIEYYRRVPIFFTITAKIGGVFHFILLFITRSSTHSYYSPIYLQGCFIINSFGDQSLFFIFYNYLFFFLSSSSNHCSIMSDQFRKAVEILKESPNHWWCQYSSEISLLCPFLLFVCILHSISFFFIGLIFALYTGQEDSSISDEFDGNSIVQM